MDAGEPDDQILTLDLHAIKDEQWDALMESHLAPDDLLAAVLNSWSEKEETGYARDEEEDSDFLYAAENEEEEEA